MQVEHAYRDLNTGQSADRWLDSCVAPVEGFRSITAAVILLFAVLSVPIGWFSYGMLNQDAISYLALAQHLLAGRPDLSVSGTWSPLFVWLLAALLPLVGMDLAVRLAMALSGLVFVMGCLLYYRETGAWFLAAAAALLTAVLAALFTGSTITPDLLSAGLMLLGWRCFARGRHLPSAVGAGVLLGFAYLAKAVMLPVALAAVLAVTAIRLLSVGQALRKQEFFRGSITLAAILLVVAPWTALLSAKYHHFTVTRSAMPQWQFISPPDQIPNQPTNIQFIVPEPGRQSQFEDESIDTRPPWSPFHSRAYFAHYAKRVVKNVSSLHASTAPFDMFGIGFAALLLFGTAAATRPDPSLRLRLLARWPGLAVPALLLTGAYCLNYSGEPRYHLILVPVSLAGGLQLWCLAGDAMGGRLAALAATALGAATALLAHTSMAGLQQANFPDGNLTPEAKAIAGALRDAGLVSAVAYVGPSPDAHPAALVPFFLGTTFNGTQDVETLDDVEAACARLLVVARGPRAALFEQSSRYRRVARYSPQLEALMRAHWFDIYWRVDPGAYRRPCNRAETLVPR